VTATQNRQDRLINNFVLSNDRAVNLSTHTLDGAADFADASDEVIPLCAERWFCRHRVSP
jgi:hypothetical protein